MVLLSIAPHASNAIMTKAARQAAPAVSMVFTRANTIGCTSGSALAAALPEDGDGHPREPEGTLPPFVVGGKVLYSAWFSF